MYFTLLSNFLFLPVFFEYFTSYLDWTLVARLRYLVWLVLTMHYVHFVKYDDAVSFYDAVSDTIRRRGGNRGIFTEEGVDTVAYFGGNHGSRV